MLLKTTRLTIVVLLLYTGNLAFAEIYKWVDEQGQVTYSDIPQDESSAPAGIQKTQPDNPPENAADGRNNYQKRLLDSFTQERQQREQKKAEQEKQLAEQKQRCAQARQRLSEYEHAGFLYNRDDSGERVILNDEQHTTAMEQARADVKQHCN